MAKKLSEKATMAIRQSILSQSPILRRKVVLQAFEDAWDNFDGTERMPTGSSIAREIGMDLDRVLKTLGELARDGVICSTKEARSRRYYPRKIFDAAMGGITDDEK
jgi:hypothetical protein